jgi:hypothetical protein
VTHPPVTGFFCELARRIGAAILARLEHLPLAQSAPHKHCHVLDPSSVSNPILLQVEFCGRAIYYYFGVPAAIHQGLLGAPRYEDQSSGMPSSRGCQAEDSGLAWRPHFISDFIILLNFCRKFPAQPTRHPTGHCEAD